MMKSSIKIISVILVILCLFSTTSCSALIDALKDIENELNTDKHTEIVTETQTGTETNPDSKLEEDEENSNPDNLPYYTRVGNYIYFGSYPQTIKADEVEITETQNEKGYFLGNDGEYYAKVVANPFEEEGYVFSTGETVVKGNVYYFKVEPIKWRILSEENGKAFLFCDSIIDNQAYHDDFFEGSNKYIDSTIRKWLNEQFYETAFERYQRKIILTTSVDNSSSTGGYNANSSKATDDKIFLLAYTEVCEADYGFTSSTLTEAKTRKKVTSDYTRANGVCMNKATEYFGNGNWWLRSPSPYDSEFVKSVTIKGTLFENSDFFSDSCLGVVPAMWIELKNN